MRVGFFSIVLVAAACGGDHKRPPLEEVPIDNGSHATADVPSAPNAMATASATAAAPEENVVARAKALIQRGDRAGARALLEPRVDDKSATTEEKQLLKGICKAARDTKCLAKLK